MSKPLYAVIMLSHNQTELTCRAIASLPGAADNPEDIRLYWIDNGSTTDHRHAVLNTLTITEQAGISRLKPIFNDENRGFPKAVNQGISESTEPYVILINNDVVIPPAQEQPSGQALFDLMARSLQYANGSLAATTSTSGWQDRQTLIKKGWMGQTSIVPLKRENHAAFFCTMITRETIQRVGYLSEEFGMGFGEDDDYQERMEDEGLLRILNTHTHVHHDRRSTWKAIYNPEEIAERQNHAQLILMRKYGRKAW